VAKNNAAKEAAKKVSGSTLIHFGHADWNGLLGSLSAADSF
jgi:hypothetical protein